MLSFHPRCIAIAACVFFVSSTMAAGSAGKGKVAYTKNGCWQCHGFVGQGSVAGPKLAPDPMPLEALSAFVRNTNGAMPPYQKAASGNGFVNDTVQKMEDNGTWKKLFDTDVSSGGVKPELPKIDRY